MTDAGLVAGLHPPLGMPMAAEHRPRVVTFDSRRVLRGLYIGRLVLAATVFLAVVGSGWHAEDQGPLIPLMA